MAKLNFRLHILLYAAALAAVCGIGLAIKSGADNVSVFLLGYFVLSARINLQKKHSDIMLAIIAASTCIVFFPLNLITAGILLFCLGWYVVLYFYSIPFISLGGMLKVKESEILEKKAGLEKMKNTAVTSAEKEDAGIESEIKSITSLYTAAKDLSYTLKVKDTAESIKEIIKKIFKYNFKVDIDNVSMALVLKKRNDFGIEESFGFDEEYLKTKEKEIVKSILHHAESGSVIYDPEFKGDSGQGEGFIKSVLYVPFMVEKKLLGVIFLAGSVEKLFTDSQVESMKVLANQMAMSLEKVYLYEEVELLSETDSLTGLFVHRYFQEKLENELKRALRYDQKLSFVMTDIDFFKKINDTYGHLAGDYILKDIARILKNMTSPADTVARYGGEEFVIIMPETEKDSAHAKAVRIRKEIEKYPFKFNGTDIKVTMSMGVASYPADAISRRNLIEEADKALYKAKENGRNRVMKS
jgi:diguanylate cyclase (GGDEF)-like protein